MQQCKVPREKGKQFPEEEISGTMKSKEGSFAAHCTANGKVLKIIIGKRRERGSELPQSGGAEADMSEELQKKKHGGEHDFWQKVRLFSETASDYVICFYLILMLAVFPLYSQEGYAHIGTDKASFFCRASVAAGAILAIPLTIWLAVGIAAFLRRGKEGLKAGKIRERNVSWTDLSALVYGCAVLVSYGCSRYRENAFWGAKGWYMGLVPQLTLVLIYFLVSRLWKPREWMVLPMLGASAAVFLLGCVNRFGFYPIRMQYASPMFISTIGNINWFCGYAVTTVFFGAALLWLKTEWKPVWKMLLMMYTALGFTALVIQGSESGLATLAAVLLLMFCLSVKEGEKMLVFWQEMTLLWGGCLFIAALRLLAPDRMSYTDGLADRLTRGWLPAVMTVVSALLGALVWRTCRKGRYPARLFRTAAQAAVCGMIATIVSFLALAAVNTVRPGSIGPLSEYGLFTFDENWGSSRGATWSVGVRCFMQQDPLHKLVGVGPDCMPEYIYNGAEEELLLAVQEKFGAARLTNAHNEWLTILVNTGVLGLAGFAGMMTGGIRRLLRGGGEEPFACACGFCLFAYTVNNIFSFQQAVSAGTAFVIFGMGTAFLRRNAVYSLLGN